MTILSRGVKIGVAQRKRGGAHNPQVGGPEPGSDSTENVASGTPFHGRLSQVFQTDFRQQLSVLPIAASVFSLFFCIPAD